MADNEKNTVNRENGTNSAMDINTDESISGTSHLNEPVTSEDEVEKLKSEIAELKDKYLRQVAEFENFRRRTAKERIEMIQTAGKEVITSLLEVLDDCDRAEKQLQASEDTLLKEGIQLVFNKFRNTMQSKGENPCKPLVPTSIPISTKRSLKFRPRMKN